MAATLAGTVTSAQVQEDGTKNLVFRKMGALATGLKCTLTADKHADD